MALRKQSVQRGSQSGTFGVVDMKEQTMEDAERQLNMRASLSHMQAISPVFRGFTEEELDEMFPYLSLVEFEESDPIAMMGEDATWVGLLLSGELVVRDANGAELARAESGGIIGEMALFAGGKRRAHIVGGSMGIIAALLFADLPVLFETVPHTAHKLMIIFGAASVGHTLPKQNFYTKAEALEHVATADTKKCSADAAGGSGAELVGRFPVASQVLAAKGLDPAELMLFFEM